MQRIWRTKHNPELIRLMEESVDITLYLVQEKGPLSFVFQDDNKKRFHINIGEIISCSCGGGKREHCVHTIYVLNRIFKIQLDNELIIQLNFTDNEISNMLNSRNKEKPTNRSNKKLIFDEENKEIRENRMSLYDDITCSICQEDMYNFQNLFYCSNSCGHNFHLHCLKVWSEYKIAVSDIITCPMCRSDWTEEFKKALISYKSAKKNIFRSHKNINCKVCSRSSIKGDRLRCLICEDYDICIECYILNKHSHRMIVKKSPDERWMGVDINKEDKYNIKGKKLSQYLISLLEDYIDCEVDEKRCIICKSDRSSSLQLLKFKQLSCKHLIHFKCAETIFKLIDTNAGYTIDLNFNICSYDKLYIFPGLKNLGFIITDKTYDNRSNTAEKETKQENLFVRKYGKDFKKKNYINNLKSPLAKINKGINSGFNLMLNIEKIEFKETNYEKESSRKVVNKYSKKLKPIDKIEKDNKNNELSLPIINILKIRVLDMKNIPFKLSPIGL